MFSLKRDLPLFTAAITFAAALTTLGVTNAATAAPTNLSPAASTTDQAPVALCADTPGKFHCLAERLPVPAAQPARFSPATAPQFSDPSSPSFRGYTPDDLVNAYRVPASTTTATVAIVDAYDNPSVESDLATYRSYYHLPACTTANGCFSKVNQNGATSPLPAVNSSWRGEIDLDVQMVSAMCPTCHILLVEANSADDSGAFDLETAVQTAVAKGATYVSMSWGGAEWGSETGVDNLYLNDPNVTYVASAGDDNYAAGTMWPAVSPNTIAVGGTKLIPASGTSRGWTETTWNEGTSLGTGSGCSSYEAQPAWQAANSNADAACPTASVANDLSVTASTANGVSVYTNSNWYIYGGTSVGAPLVAAMYAVAGQTGGTTGAAEYAYSHAAKFNDVTSGNNGTCSPSRLCTAGTGWDGPTGLGSPNGLSALANVPDAPSPSPTTSAPATPAPTTSAPTSTGGGGTSGGGGGGVEPTSAPTADPTGDPTPGSTTITITRPDMVRTYAGQAATVTVAATDSDPTETLTYTASGLPDATTIDSTTGTITGTPTHHRAYRVTVTATDSTGTTASTSFIWLVKYKEFATKQKTKVHGHVSRGHTIRVTAPTMHLNNPRGRKIHPHITYQWYLNGKRIKHATHATFHIPAGRKWHNQRLTVRITARAHGYKPLTVTRNLRIR